MKSNSPISPSLPRRLSLVVQTAQSLREALRAGHWQGHLPGERELCTRLQVSRQTLRLALQEMQREGSIGVARGQRRQILAKPSRSASATSSKVIAALSSRPLLAMSPSSVFLVDELRASLARAGFVLDLHVSTACFAARPARALEALIARAPAAAWLVFGSVEAVQSWFVRRQLPCLVVGSSAPGVGLPSVDADYRASCRHAGGRLWSKGHRRIALILPEGAYGGDLESERGLREALACHDPSALLVLRHDGTAVHLCAQLDMALRLKVPPTAFIVGRAAHVLTVMMHLMQRGKRIPRDVAVVSRDDETFLQHTVPSVTRYAMSSAQFARRVSVAVRQLADTGILPPRGIRLLQTLIPGETV